MSLEFDEFIQPECEVETEPNPTTCQPDLTDGSDDDDDVVPPSDDERCADPAFAEANPDLCRGYPRLILKPEYAITESGKTVQYSTYLRVGGNEQELTLGLTYSSADVEVAVIEADDGLATGVQPGITTIAVAWQNLNAFAQIEVVENCAELNTNFILLLDNSKSSTVAFSGTYSTKLSFAKTGAVDFADSVNYSKDQVGVIKFDIAATVVQALSVDVDAIKAAINGITSSTNKTDLYEGLKKAKETLDAGTGRKVIVLFSDGEDNVGSDFVSLANEFKGAGGVIIVVALRSWGTYFNNLYQIASAGFFLSAYGATQAEVLEFLPGLKSFICSGDCQPDPGTYPMAQLNYTGFANWDVFQGYVDLIGLGIWDVLPGNGLYVDMAGTKDIGAGVLVPSPGGLRSKTTFDFVAGETYKFSIYVAGNNVGNEFNEPVQVTIGTLLSETITPTDKEMPFTLYEFEFTPGANESAKIEIEMVPTNNDNVGPLIDDITLENMTTATVMLTDNFDNENLVTIPFGYSYYSCIETPPGAQSADPTPPTPPLAEG